MCFFNNTQSRSQLDSTSFIVVDPHQSTDKPETMRLPIFFLSNVYWLLSTVMEDFQDGIGQNAWDQTKIPLYTN